MSLEPSVVQRTAHDLADKHLVRAEENFKSGVEKYLQRICNTQFSDFQFDPPQFAIICLLLLRGPQTPGELKARSGRLHAFADNADVVGALTTLIEREDSPLAIKLPRTPGRRDAEYMHLLSGPVAVEFCATQAQAVKSTGTSERVSVHDLVQRVGKLEAEVAELKEQLAKSL